MTINSLPDELLCRIFTIASEVELDFRNSPKLRWENHTHDLQNHSRRQKPVIRYVSRVSRRWNNVIERPESAHLWVSAATLTCGKNTCLQLVEFHKILKDSNHSDLDIAWRGEVDYIGTEPDAQEIQIFLHGLEMLLPYGRQLRSFRACIVGNEVLSCILAFVNTLGPTAGFDWFGINGPEVLWGVLARINAPNPKSVLPDRYSFRTETYSFQTLSSLSSLTHINLHAIHIGDDFVVPKGLMSFTVMNDMSELPWMWSTLIGLLRQCSDLERLELWLP